VQKLLLNKKDRNIYRDINRVLDPQQKKIKEQSYLYRLIRLENCSFLSSLNLLAWSLASSRNPSFHERKEGLPLLKMKSLLCFQICQAPKMKIPMKNLLLKSCLASSIIRWNCWPNLQLMFKCFQHS
jgi:hypothetical protein